MSGSEIDALVIESDRIDASIIWLHGLGADKYNFLPIIEELNLDLNLRYIFPQAEIMPISCYKFLPMRAWYDLKPAADPSINAREADLCGIERSFSKLSKLIDKELLTMPADRIIIAGFSQGALMALYTALHYPQQIAAAICLSGYWPNLALPSSYQTLPIFIGHGLADDIVPYALGLDLQAKLHNFTQLEFHTYDTHHDISHTEVADIAQFILRILS